jgi:hypothetical protein
MVNVPAGATGQVCYTVLVARLQSTSWIEKAGKYLANLIKQARDWIAWTDTGQKSTAANLKDIRGPDKSD